MRQDCCKELIAVDDRSYRWLPSFVGALIKRDKNTIAVDDRSYGWLPLFVGALIKREPHGIKHNSAPSPSGRGLG